MLRCYLRLRWDTGARPHELLKLRIVDIVWSANQQCRQFQVNVKTGSRSLPQDFLAAANAADNDADYVKQISEDLNKQIKRPT